ncbi:DUF2512 family protein [Paenibacillus tarimensis]|uniref:DUF2512 family protein n=1 Tax=Paenibacillus tarimensis TaxID=416012 RepID=UPI001F48CB1A|nr:DUF2512 family protein [Paenibacillus tarimensis]MCF2945846.1 YndM family protein [Paenibacillus tarimensis]
MKSFLLKLAGNGFIVILTLMLFTEMPWWSALSIALVLTVTAYLLGDLTILPRTNNITATLVDAVWAALVIWGASALIEWQLHLSELLVIVLFLGLFEYVFHIRLLRLQDEGANTTKRKGDKAILS